MITRKLLTAEGPRDALSVEILSTVAQLYEKFTFENTYSG